MSKIYVDPEFIKNEMWKEANEGMCVVCDCERDRFMNKITEQEVYTFVNNKQEQEHQERLKKIEEKRCELEELER